MLMTLSNLISKIFVYGEIRMVKKFRIYNKRWVLGISLIGFLMFILGVKIWDFTTLSSNTFGLMLLSINIYIRWKKISNELKKKITIFLKLDLFILFSVTTTFFNRVNLFNDQSLAMKWGILTLIIAGLYYLFLSTFSKEKIGISEESIFKI